jgi:Protein kinase domain/NACHT domain
MGMGREDSTDLATAGAGQTRNCPICHSRLMVGSFREFCPICVLYGALTSGSVRKVRRPSNMARLPLRFENYELVKGADGRPLELGRGSMGVTYKAIDVDLRCPVTLKRISENYLADESVRARFLREARAAASVRHPNVASVFHLGRRGRDYFYTMEFVEGETLDSLIKRSGRIEVKLALDVATQVAAGLDGVHQQKLVHRDIKPTNIMVCFSKEGGTNVKIIDLGLAKTTHEAGSQTAISISGGFAGTPEFASPEQFAGVGVDIRSDIYSLGVTLWEMLTARSPFRGSPAEVMHQHLHVPPPLDQLKGLPQPAIVLLEVLLEKDPKRRLQSPAEVLTAIATVTGAIDKGSRIMRRGLQKSALDAYAVVRSQTARLGPKKISITRLPVTGNHFFGREADIAFLDEAWANERVNLVTIAAWAGVGKSTLVNHWLVRMAAEHYRSAEFVFGWSFYRQSSSVGRASSADEFIDAALSWFGDPDPRLGTAWEKGERLAKLVAHRRGLLVLDGLEPLQDPPGPQEGWLREPALQALLRGLATFNSGLCVITTRLLVADLADYERPSVLRCDLEQLSSDAGAQLLRALSVIGDEEKLRNASDEFGGHCLALTLLGSYLTDAHNGDIRCRKEVSDHLGHDDRQGFHARKVMESYKVWLGEGPELRVLRILGLFDRPADEKALASLLKPPSIRGLTEFLTDLSPTEWQMILARLRRAKLLAPEDPHHPGHLDSHPLVREYFGEQFRNQQTDAWKECNRRLYDYYRMLAPPLPDTLREMEPLFLATICACNAGLLREALHDVYIPRIQRGQACFAANVLGARGALLSVLTHFFADVRWGSFVEMDAESPTLAAEDQLFLLMQAALYLTATRGMGAPEARMCYDRAESLCGSLKRPQLLYLTLIGQWRFSISTEKLTTAMEIANRVNTLAQKQNDPAAVLGACRALAATLYFMGDFEISRQYATRGVQIWRRGGVQSQVGELSSPAVACLCYGAMSEWHFAEVTSSKAIMADGVSLAKTLNDTHSLAFALSCTAFLALFERSPIELERSILELMELSARANFAFWLAEAKVLRGWACSVSGDPVNGISLIEEGMEDYRATGSTIGRPMLLALKAEALYLADRTSEALEIIEEAQANAQRFEVSWWSAELHRLRGLFLSALGADETQIEVSFREAIKTAKRQKSISLAARAETSYAEYRAQKAGRVV